jgi:hypothetical protein
VLTDEERHDLHRTLQQIQDDEDRRRREQREARAVALHLRRQGRGRPTLGPAMGRSDVWGGR